MAKLPNRDLDVKVGTPMEIAWMQAKEAYEQMLKQSLINVEVYKEAIEICKKNIASENKKLKS